LADSSRRCYICRLAQNPDPLPTADRETGDGCNSSSFPGIAQTPEPAGTGQLESSPALPNPSVESCPVKVEPDPEMEFCSDPTNPCCKSDEGNPDMVRNQYETDPEPEPEFAATREDDEISVEKEMQLNQAFDTGVGNLQTDVSSQSRVGEDGKLDANNPLDCADGCPTGPTILDCPTKNLDLEIQNLDDHDESKSSLKEEHFRSEEEKLIYDILKSKRVQKRSEDIKSFETKQLNFELKSENDGSVRNKLGLPKQKDLQFADECQHEQGEDKVLVSDFLQSSRGQPHSDDTKSFERRVVNFELKSDNEHSGKHKAGSQEQTDLLIANECQEEQGKEENFASYRDQGQSADTQSFAPKKLNFELEEKNESLGRKELGSPQQMDLQFVDKNEKDKGEEETLVFDILKTSKVQQQLPDIKSFERDETSIELKTEKESFERNETGIDDSTDLPAVHEPQQERGAEELQSGHDDPGNPGIEVEEANESGDEFRTIPSAKSSSKSSLGTFFQQKLFRSASAASSTEPTASSSCHSSPETKCVNLSREY